jgi:hypothetical protein
MKISNFDDLLRAAHQQAQPQRLLMVFANADLPDDCTPAQRQAYDAGEGGALVPAMCVDKAPAEVASFATLKHEAGCFQKPWQVVFVAALAGQNNTKPASQDIEAALDRMVESVKTGAIDMMLAFDQQGTAISLNPSH